ncbi:MAG TPA: PilW family protein [Steroidobacteraceae bacterium]|nr:PilW family protein [Gammaproteobacteria bacterium]HEV2287080.1 PilW family protein [Steroidobacteraceae bacterium]
MNTERRFPADPRRNARGFTLVELMVTIAIALFLLGGLVTIVQTVRRAYTSQQALVQLQDQQRFAITLLTDVIQSGGYFDNPTGDTVLSALPAVAPNFGSGQAFYGTQGAAAPAAGDTIYVRFRTAQNDGIINCSGSQNTAFNPDHVYTNEFYVNPGTGQLMCSLDGAAGVPLVNGVVNLQIYYGVKRSVPFSDYNVDTYEQANAMQVPNDWDQISSVRVVVTFANPLWGSPNQPVTTQQYITFERVIQVMSRAGNYT